MIATLSCWLVKIVISVIICLAASIIGLRLWLQPEKAMYKNNVNLKGKVALITGGNSGIGLETARDLARRGATVIIASRDENKSEEAVKDIIETTGNLHVYHKCLDLTSFSNIKDFAEDFHKSFDRLDILVNNAGCAGIKPAFTEDGIEKVTQINYVGPFLLTNLLLDKLIESKPSRIVIVSSKAHEFHNFDPDDIAATKTKFITLNQRSLFKVYANSKLCNVLWANALAKRLPKGVTANSLHPGLVMTNIFHRMPWFSRRILTWMIANFFKTSVEGAQTTIYLCVAPELDEVSGEYFSECKIVKALDITKDEQLIDKVWDNTMKLVEGK